MYLTYSQIAFITLFKVHRINSLILNGQSFSAFGLNMSEKTFRKYMKELEEKGLLIKQGKHKQIIGWDKIEKLKKVKYFLKECGVEKGMTITQARQVIQEFFALRNFRQQQFRIEKNNAINDVLEGKHTSGRIIKELVKKARKSGMSFEEYLRTSKARNKSVIVSGSRHISKLLGCSPATANKLLQRMVKKGIISRHIVRYSISFTQLTHEIFDSYKTFDMGVIFPSNNRLKFVKGSEISILS